MCGKTKQDLKKDILADLEQNPSVKPNQMVNEKMVQVLSSDNFKWSTLEEVAYNYSDMKRIHNIREAYKREKNPHGENFEALAVFKAKCDENDPFFIYRINNKALNGQPSYVFKSSRDMAQLALEMDMDKTGCLKEEYAYFDAKHDRCRGFKTSTLWVYHPRKLLCLAKMEVEKENTENMITFWNTFNEMLGKVAGVSEYKLNPCGIICDEHHGNWNSLKEVFGESLVKRSASCEFHFKQSVQRHATKLGSKKEEFIHKANAMLNALTLTEYEAAFNAMLSFVSTDKFDLENWLQWWHLRRTHIFKAFKPSLAPSTNLAEVGHSKMSTVGSNYMSLLEAARHDVASTIRHNTEVKLFRTGETKGGRGISANLKIAKKRKNDLKRAQAYAKELENGEIRIEQNPICVPSSGIHRPRCKSQKQKKKATKPAPSSQNESKYFYARFFSSIINLKRCYGCKKEFKDKYKHPPKDIILKHYCHRQYRHGSGNPRQTKDLQAAYFHLNLDCTRKIVPLMEISDIIINAETSQALSPAHKSVLQKFGIHI